MIFLVWGFFPFSSLQNEWRTIRVQQSRGWVHYAIHRPEPHIMLFRRRINYHQQQEAVAAQMLAK
jgi:cyclin-dependent kinase regulatory subunit CKS1